MEWKKCYLDVVLVPCGLFILMGYHLWLWNKIRREPFSTIIGTNSHGTKYWVASIMKDNEKKNILAVQTIRNTIMGSTLMATTSILLCSGLAAILSSTYSIKKPLNDTVYGAHGEFMMALKYVTLLILLLFSFLCHSMSIRFLNQVNFLINAPQGQGQGQGEDDDHNSISSSSRVIIISPMYVSELLERGLVLNIVGNRLFYGALPLLLWIFGPLLVFLCSLTIVPMLYHLDIVFQGSSSLDKGDHDIITNGNSLFLP